jgi:hypothetical protein
MIREGSDSNLLSIEISLIKIIKTSMIRINPREKNPWEKGKTTNQLLGIQRRSLVQVFPSYKGKSEYRA